MSEELFRRPRMLEPFCCEGGGSKGYWNAGFDVYGIDLFKHTNSKGKRVGFSRDRYPFPSWQGDAIQALTRLLDGGQLAFQAKEWRADFGPRGGTTVWLGLADFDAIHASPPCQHASAGTRAARANGTSDHPALIEPTRELLEQTGLPWVIENVKGAALRDPIMLCGSHFGLVANDEDGLPLRLERHRLFESNFTIDAPGPCVHDESRWAAGVYGGGRGRKPGQTAAEHRYACRKIRKGGYTPKSKKVQQELLGIDWMTKGGMAQSLPPVYTEFIGRQMLDHIGAVTA